MSTCCEQNAPPGGCRQGRDCPVDAARAAALVKRTCEALGSCQNPERECSGACEQVPSLPGQALLPSITTDTCIFWGVVMPLSIATLVVVCGVAVWVWRAYGGVIQRICWSAASLLF